MGDNKISEAVRKLAYETGMWYSQNEKCQPGVPFYAFTQGELDRFVEKLSNLHGEAVPVAMLDQILLDPKNQPSQFGTVPTEYLEHCEEMISDLVHQFGDRGCTCTFPEDDCCAYARAEHYARHPQPAELNEVSSGHELARAVEKALGNRDGKRDAELDELLEMAMHELNAIDINLPDEVSGNSGELPPLPAPKYLAKLSKDGEWAELTVMPDWSAEMWAWGTDEVFSKQQMQDYARSALNQNGK